jgi:hypothetical protein
VVEESEDIHQAALGRQSQRQGKTRRRQRAGGQLCLTAPATVDRRTSMVGRLPQPRPDSSRARAPLAALRCVQAPGSDCEAQTLRHVGPHAVEMRAGVCMGLHPSRPSIQSASTTAGSMCWYVGVPYNTPSGPRRRLMLLKAIRTL